MYNTSSGLLLKLLFFPLDELRKLQEQMKSLQEQLKMATIKQPTSPACPHKSGNQTVILVKVCISHIKKL